MLFQFMLVITMPFYSVAFNVDDKFPILFSAPISGSYFGYNVAFLNTKNGNRIIVSAPRANSTNEITICDVNYPQPTCIPLDIGKETSASSNKRKADNSWLGVSLDISDDNGHIVACGHLAKSSTYKPIGVCYTAGQTSGQTVKTSLVDWQTGISAHFLKKSRSFIVAAMKNGYSSAVTYIESNDESHTWRVEQANFNYFGYALTSGNFFSKNEVQFAAGAPRDRYIGKVYIQQGGDLTSAISLSGTQIGEYFGSALCAVDLNNDGWDDLIVGAPLHTIGSDEGKVYVYKNNQNKKLSLHKEITGKEVSARFGTTIAAIGDLNKDGFQDIAIGAPYENNGQGAVYIYHGSPDGINPMCQQKIRPIQSKTSGFGISIAGRMDFDGNGYPDIVIGAYGSDEVLLHITREVLNITATIKANKDLIDVDQMECSEIHKICFTLKVCFKSQSLKNNTDIIQTLLMDTLMLTGPRVLILPGLNSGSKNGTSVSSIDSNNTCQVFNVSVNEKPRDYFTPIKIQLSFKLREECKYCPILDPSISTTIEYEVRFKTKCGARCNTDLKVEAWISDLNETPLVIGSRSQLSLEVNVTNLGDAAYITELTVHTPEWMTFDHSPINCHQKSPLSCDLDNILEMWQTKTLRFKLNIAKISPIRISSFNITCIASSQSDEKNENDNKFTITVPVRRVADIFVLGSTNQEQIFYDRNAVHLTENSTVNFSHTFEVGNLGPTDIWEPLRFQLQYPAYIDGDEPIIKIALDANAPVECNGTIPDFVQKGEIQDKMTPPAPIHISKRSTKNEPRILNGTQGVGAAVPANVAILNCSTTRCESVWCTWDALFLKDARFKLSFNIRVHSARIVQNMGNKDAVVIVTEGWMYSSDVNAHQPKEHKPDFAKVMTEIKPGGVPPSEPVATWIIVVSCIGGNLLLLLLVILLRQLGFFKRPQKEKLKRMTRNVENLIAEEDSKSLS